jgi:hypothetical protein
MPPRAAPFFRLVVEQAAPDAGKKITWTLLYAPTRNAMRITQNRVPPYHTGIGPYWRAIPASARTGLRRATAGLDPFPASSTWQAGR